MPNSTTHEKTLLFIYLFLLIKCNQSGEMQYSPASLPPPPRTAKCVFCIMDVKERKPHPRGPATHSHSTPQVISLAADPNVRCRSTHKKDHRHGGLQRRERLDSAHSLNSSSSLNLSRCQPEQETVETAYLGIWQVPPTRVPAHPGRLKDIPDSLSSFFCLHPLPQTLPPPPVLFASCKCPHLHWLPWKPPSYTQEMALPVCGCRSWRAPVNSLGLGVGFGFGPSHPDCFHFYSSQIYTYMYIKTHTPTLASASLSLKGYPRGRAAKTGKLSTNSN